MIELQELKKSIVEENNGDELSIHTGELILRQAYPEVTVPEPQSTTLRIRQAIGEKLVRGMDTMHQYSTLAPVPA